MRNVLLQPAIKLNKNRKRMKKWQWMVRVLAAIVVFCTTYVLILPAITMERKTVCGIEEHQHTQACYERSEKMTYTCELNEQDIVVHSHDAFCYNEQEELICVLTETAEHIHTEECYVQEQEPVCDYVHVHGENCEEALQVLICELEESEEHTHDENCYEMQESVCELTTEEGHVHDETCYPKQLSCEKEEVRLHTHEASCYDEEGGLICALPQVVAHTHVQECLMLEEQISEELSCEKEEHVHEDSCYMKNDSAASFLCGSGVHAHMDSCYDESGVLICTIPEHAHEAACVVADLDLNADVETEAEWKESLGQLSLTGNWPCDILAVAQSQLGYRESTRNLVLTEEGELKGYTRYGAWYGDPYGDWNALYVSFCLKYANVQNVPSDANAANWAAALEAQQMFRTPDLYVPKAGDIVFFGHTENVDISGEQTFTAERVGIVVELIEGENTAQIKTIEGDADGQVAYAVYDMHDSVILGYGDIPSGENHILTYVGGDYTVTVTCDSDAGIPEDAVLAVREIQPGTEEYNTYYQQSVEALKRDAVEEEAVPEFSFMRFFDISFLVNGAAVEPMASVEVQIHYDEVIEKNEDENGLVVHFAQDGIEILDADTYSDGSEQVDTFAFTQDSFSVVGTALTNYTRSLGVTSATRVNFNSLDGSGKTLYVIYTEYNGRYYAITAKSGNVTGYSKEITVNNDGSISWTADDSNIFWSFNSNGGNSYYIQNYGSSRYIHAFDNSTNQNPDYGTTTAGKNPSTLTLMQDGTFIAQGNNYFTGLTNTNGIITFNRVSNRNSASRFYIAKVGSAASYYNVWFDGTNGGLMNLYGSLDQNRLVEKNEDGAAAVVSLPETWQSPAKYPYVLRGWYDINTHQYYEVNPNDTLEVTAAISADTVFYADWIAATYDVGQNNEDVENSLDTNDFITTHVFDYNTLFNVLSLSHTGSISSTGHSETWTMVDGGNVPYNNEKSLEFLFVDYDGNGDFSYANGRDAKNNNQGDAITANIISTVRNASGKDLMNLLFDPTVSVIGKNYVGTGNYLFQYMDSTTENYDGEHDGYYYLDSRLNAASYNQTEARFYLYDYLERTSDSRKDGGIGQYSDFLPFNSPYIFESDQLDNYIDMIRTPGYEYDAKDGAASFQDYNNTDDAITNYFFGIKTDIEFFLPNNAGEMDQYDNYGNISTRGEHMVFEFHGDDDLWVFVDGELLLDVGGLHGVMFGEIDFSTGVVTAGKDSGSITTRTFQEILGHNIAEGTHTLTVYYMERGSSQSNCAIYFNIAPRYSLEITKEDIFTADKLDGAVFSIYICEDCANGGCTGKHTAQLWDSEADHKADMEDGSVDSAKYEFTVINGKAYCWGLSAGKTYYIKETTPPQEYDPGYPMNDDVIRITLNNRGTATIETTTLHGTDGKITEGYAVIEQDVNDTLKIVSLTVTNQRNKDTTQIRVKKVWDEKATELPNSVTAYLTVNGERVGRPAVLTDANGWVYTWTGLPKYESDGTTPIIYEVEEIQVSGFNTEYTYKTEVAERIEWVRSEAMEDNATYILFNGERALAYGDNPNDNSSNAVFYWMTRDKAQETDAGDAQWTVTTNQYGFRLVNGNGYVLTYDRSSNRFYGVRQSTADLNQVIYYLDGRLVVHDNDRYFQMDVNGSVVSADGLVFSLIRKDVVTGTVVEMKNVLMENEKQTFVEVNKVWDDHLDHRKDSVTIHLYADGKDTGRILILNEASSWQGSFEGLAYYVADGETPVVYTVVEDEPPDYDASYEQSPAKGKQVVTWIKAQNLTEGGSYRIFSGANALSVDKSGALTVAANDSADTSQWWVPVTNNNRTILKSYTGNYYLRCDNNSVSVVKNADRASAVALNEEAITVNGRYLQMTSTSISASAYEYNATLFTVALRTEDEGKPGLSVKVTNSEERKYELPVTGSLRTPLHYTFGGLILIMAVLMYINIFKKKKWYKGD